MALATMCVALLARKSVIFGNGEWYCHATEYELGLILVNVCNTAFTLYQDWICMTHSLCKETRMYMEHNILYTNSLDKLEHVNVSVVLVQVCELRITGFQVIRCSSLLEKKKHCSVVLFCFFNSHYIHIIFLYSAANMLWAVYSHIIWTKFVKEMFFFFDTNTWLNWNLIIQEPWYTLSTMYGLEQWFSKWGPSTPGGPREGAEISQIFSDKYVAKYLFIWGGSLTWKPLVLNISCSIWFHIGYIKTALLFHLICLYCEVEMLYWSASVESPHHR